MRESLKRILRPVKNKLLDKRSVYFLKKNGKKKANGIIRIGMLVFEPETWDKLKPLYENIRNDVRFSVFLILIPSFDTNLALSKEYGYEKEFFKNEYPEILLAYDRYGDLLDLKTLNLDFVFYQDPYDLHYPKAYRSKEVVKYAKICYIPYGYSLLKNFTDLLITNTVFWRNVYVFFAENITDGNAIKAFYRKTISAQIQHVEYLGYPALESYLEYPPIDRIKSITWSPRWTYDKMVGGSHFIEYNQTVLDIANRIEQSVIIRPHPMMFVNFEKNGIMTSAEIDAFKKKADELGIIIDDRSPIDQILQQTDLLITDISSIIISFFATGRPIIYCECDLEPNDDLKEMMKAMYIAKSEEDIEYYVGELLRGNDYLKEKRERLLSSDIFNVHLNSTKRITEYLYCKGRNEEL